MPGLTVNEQAIAAGQVLRALDKMGRSVSLEFVKEKVTELNLQRPDLIARDDFNGYRQALLANIVESLNDGDPRKPR